MRPNSSRASCSIPAGAPTCPSMALEIAPPWPRRRRAPRPRVSLPDFLLPIYVEGERAAVIARDVPTHVFFYKFPAQAMLEDYTEKTPEEVRKLTEGASGLDFLAWAYHLLAHVIVWPRMRVTDIYALQDAWTIPLAMYCRAVGWVTPDMPTWAQFLRAIRQHPENIPTRIHLAPRRPHRRYRRAILLRTAMARPASFVTDVIRYVAHRSGLAPAAVWQMPISELTFSLMALREEQPGTNPPETPRGGGGYGEIQI